MPHASQSQPRQDDADIARLAAEAIALAFGRPVAAAHPRLSRSLSRNPSPLTRMRPPASPPRPSPSTAARWSSVSQPHGLPKGGGVVVPFGRQRHTYEDALVEQLTE